MPIKNNTTQVSLNSDTTLDLPRLIESRLLVQANSGGGKSWLLRRLLEQSHGKVQQIILDPEGEFGTLREKYDYVLAGKGGNTPAEPRSATLQACHHPVAFTSALVWHSGATPG
jgi:DNA helicase HerA-like ATPase